MTQIMIKIRALFEKSNHFRKGTQSCLQLSIVYYYGNLLLGNFQITQHIEQKKEYRPHKYAGGYKYYLHLNIKRNVDTWQNGTFKYYLFFYISKKF